MPRATIRPNPRKDKRFMGLMVRAGMDIVNG
jgi:hypothetical protein